MASVPARRVRAGLRCAVLFAGACALAAVPADGPLLIRVERQSPADLVPLLRAGVPVVTETNGALFVRGDDGHAAWLAAHGWTATVLDARASTSDYAIVGLRPDSDVAAVAATGDVIATEENWMLVRVPRDASLEAFHAARVFSMRMPRETMDPPRPEAPRVSRAGSGDGPDPVVQKIVGAVSPAQIDAYWSDLTTNPPTGTRYSTSQGCRDAAAYVLAEFQALGIPAEYQNWSGTHAPNTIGTLLGAIEPDVVYIVEGHLDDLPSSGPAPGADDNASGSVNVLESARAMSCWSFRRSVKFMTVTGEEFGLYGSDAYAEDAQNRGEDIQGVINMDMPGWAGNGTPVPEDLDLDYNAASQPLADAFAKGAADYATGLVVNKLYCPSLSASDHYPFWQRGYKAVCGITDNEGYCGASGNYPYYHQSTDTIANCGDHGFFHSVVRTSVATLSALAGPFKIAFDRPAYGCGAVPAGIVVGDRDLDANPAVAESIVVQAWSATEPEPENVTLTEEAASSAIFRGSIGTTTGPAVHGDGLISIVEGDTLRARYVDALDCDGAADVVYDATAATDCAAPLISGVSQTSVTDTQATVVWTTDEPSDSVVRYGTGTPPQTPVAGNGNVTQHAVTLSGLQACTVYWHDARSADAAGNLAVADDGGRFFHFETYGNFGSGLQPCHEGRVSLDRSVVSCADALPIRLVDMDLNRSTTAVDTATVTVSSSTEADPETLTLVETGPNTSTFTASLPTAPGAPVAGNGILEVAHADAATATYRDADDGTGLPAVSFATGDVDCAGPAITGVRVTDLTDDRAVVRWETQEPATGRVEWGTTPALGNTAQETSSATSHALTLGPIAECGRVHFRIFATDARGNGSSADAAGVPFAFSAERIGGAIFKDDFESPSAWTLDGEWQIGAPEGRGTAPGDATAAFAGTKVLGHDLTGLGAHPGDYEPTKTERAASPVIDASALAQGQLRFRRWLNVGGGGIASIEAKRGNNWVVVWTSPNPVGLTESAWSLQTVDISAMADANPALQFAFKQYGGPTTSANRAGWNVDRVVVRSASAPDFEACGGCGGAPSFAGATSARDDDACADTGVRVSWAPAAAWGTGQTGTYAVYRSTDPAFVPDAANRVAAAVGGTSWLDAGAPDDTTLFYLVRAENDETCSTGPANGGVTDANVVRMAGRDEVSQPPPASVGASVRLEALNAAHVGISWSSASGAASYRVYRAASPSGPWNRVAEVEATSWEDRDAMGTGADAFYAVRAADACGNEVE